MLHSGYVFRPWKGWSLWHSGAAVPGVPYQVQGLPGACVSSKGPKALAIGGPTFIHTYDPCPKGWDYHPRFSNELGELGIKCGIYPLYEIVDGNIIYTWDARKTGKGRIPVKEFLTKQGRFDHLQEEHFTYIQKMVDEMWEEWEMPGVVSTLARKLLSLQLHRHLLADVLIRAICS